MCDSFIQFDASRFGDAGVVSCHHYLARARGQGRPDLPDGRVEGQRGELRGPVCGMGVCFECRVMVNGLSHVRSCQTICEPGMEIRTDD